MSDKTQSKEGIELDAAFDKWWHEEGSGMPLRPNEDFENHARRVSYVAWLAGAAKAIEILQKL